MNGKVVCHHADHVSFHITRLTQKGIPLFSFLFPPLFLHQNIHDADNHHQDDIDGQDNDDGSNLMAIPSADVLRLIQAHLSQSGLHATSRMLRQESGVGLAAPLHSSWLDWAQSGQWNLILQSLSTLDRTKYWNGNGNNATASDDTTASLRNEDLWAETHEMAILEVAAAGDLELAYAMLRLAAADLEASQVYDPKTDRKITRARHVEIALADLVVQQQKGAASSGNKNDFVLPDDYYHGETRQERRENIGQRLAKALPVQPADRLVTLLQQAVKYQSYTGALPQVQEIWHAGEQDGKEKADKTSKKKKRKVFDLLLGSVERMTGSSNTKGRKSKAESMSFNKALATVKFGKNTVCESAVFTPDGTSLVTGTSDGLIEVWNTADYQLRTDLPYQQEDAKEGLGHTEAVTALTVSNDGTLLASGTSTGEVVVWRMDSGKALRQFNFGNNSLVNCLEFTPDGSRLLATCGVHCREYGLRTSQCLREYSNGEAALTACGYHVHGELLKVWTAAVDGYMRWYHGATASFLAAWQPSSSKEVGSSVVVDGSTDVITTNPALTTVLKVTSMSPPCFLLVPRACEAYLVNAGGTLVRTFRDHSAAKENAFICGAALSPGQQWLYAVREDGTCNIFDVSKGDLERSATHVGKDSTSKVREGCMVEISALIPHPFRSHVACFSNDKRQKKGQLTIWK